MNGVCPNGSRNILRDVEVFAGRQCAHLQTVLLTNCLRRVALTTFDGWRETFGDASKRATIWSALSSPSPDADKGRAF